MTTTLHARRGLQLEPLEARTLLAGGLLSGTDSFAEVHAAVTGSEKVSLVFDAYLGNSVTITGSPTTDVTVDFAKLPDRITHLTLSNFDDIILLGADGIAALVVKDADTVQGPQLEVSRLRTENVGTVSLAATTRSATFSGTGETRIVIPDIENTTLAVGIDKLTVLSETERVYVLFTRPDQTVEFEYFPKHIDGTVAADWDQKIVFHVPKPTVPGSEPNPKPEPEVVVVFHLADEARIRRVLSQLETQPGGFDLTAEQLMSELVRNGDSGGYELAAAAAQVQTGLQLNRVTESVSHVGGSETANLLTLGSTLPSLGDLELANQLAESSRSHSTRVHLDASATTVPHGERFLAVNSLPDVISPSAESTGRATVEELYGTYVFRLDNQSRTFSEYLFERFAAELRPGNQTAVLLVDPKPNRGSSPSLSESAFDVIA